MVSPENMLISNIITITEQIIVGIVYVYTYTFAYVTTINERRRHEFEKEQGWLYRRVWREKREGRNIINTSKKKIISALLSSYVFSITSYFISM